MPGLRRKGGGMSHQPEYITLFNFALMAATMTKDGEPTDPDGEPYDMPNDEAVDTLHGLISKARDILGILDPGETETDYEIIVCVSATATSPEEAGRFAIADLRDPAIGPWFVRVRETDGNAVQRLLDAIAPAIEIGDTDAS